MVGADAGDKPPLKILVVEDLGAFRQFVASTLGSRTGVEIAEAADGLEAIQQAEAWRPDLILFDVGLPKLDGLAAARRVRQLVPSAKLLFLTQETSPEVVGAALNLGASGYVTKARAGSDLGPAVAAVLDGKLYLSPGLEFSTGWGGRASHDVQFYSDDAVLVESFSRFVRAALKKRHAAIVLATGAHREDIHEKLGQAGIDVDAHLERGTYVALDAADMLSAVMVDGQPSRDRFSTGLDEAVARAARAAGVENPRVAICGECAGLLHAGRRTDAALCLEEIGNDLIASRNIEILCGYPVSHGEEDAHAFAQICSAHTSAHYR